MTIKCQIHLQKVFARPQLPWLYGTCLASYGRYTRCFWWLQLLPYRDNVCSLRCCSFWLPSWPRPWAISSTSMKGHVSSSGTHQAPKMILIFEVAKDSFLGVDMEITRPNSEVIWKDIDIALRNAGLLAAPVGGAYKFALPWLWRQRQ